MSEYVLNIKLKDPQGVFQQIKNLEQNGIGGKVAAAGGGGGGFFSKKLGDLNLGMLAKLSGIGFGIHQLVQLGIKSSGILQGTMKMMESSIMLMLKPIADFIGLMLRPITVLMLTQFIIPFYKTVYPWFRDAAKVSGNALVQGFFPQEGQKPLIADLSFENINRQLNLAGLGINLAFTSLFVGLNRTFGAIPGFFHAIFVNAGEGIWKALSAIPGFFHAVLVLIGENIWSALTSVPGLILGAFTGLANSLVEMFASIPKLIWDALTGWISGLGLPGPSANRGGQPRFSGRTTVAAIADTLS